MIKYKACLYEGVFFSLGSNLSASFNPVYSCLEAGRDKTNVGMRDFNGEETKKIKLSFFSSRGSASDTIFADIIRSGGRLRFGGFFLIGHPALCTPENSKSQKQKNHLDELSCLFYCRHLPFSPGRGVAWNNYVS